MTYFFFFFLNLAWDQEVCVLCFFFFFFFFFVPLTLFIYFYRSGNLKTRLSHFASVDCTDSKELISSSRLEQRHCLLSVDFVTQRLPRDRLQSDSCEAQCSQNFFFSKKKRTEMLFSVLAVGTVSCMQTAGGKIIIYQSPKLSPWLGKLSSQRQIGHCPTLSSQGL